MATVTVRSGPLGQMLAEKHDVELREFLLEIGASEADAERIVANLRAEIERRMHKVIDPNWKPN